MNVHELRIGNIVMGFDGKPFEWTLQDFSILYNSKVDPNELCLPIPLIEEWLLKFGFERSGLYHVKDQVYVYDCYELCNDINEYAFYQYKFNYTQKRLVYVHQLQNLHYELTGKELTLKGD